MKPEDLSKLCRSITEVHVPMTDRAIGKAALYLERAGEKPTRAKVANLLRQWAQRGVEAVATGDLSFQRLRLSAVSPAAGRRISKAEAEDRARDFDVEGK